MTPARRRASGIPRLFASSGVSVVTLRRQAKSSSATSARRMRGAPARTRSTVAPESAPMSQKVICGRTSCGSATYLTSEMRAVKSAATTMPARIIMRSPDSPRTRAIASTRKTERRPLARAQNWMPRPVAPKRIPSTAPKDAPVATPSVSGLARGFAKSA